MELKHLVMGRRRGDGGQSTKLSMRLALLGLGVIALLLAVRESEGFSGGAPDSTPICSSMIPGHGPPPQTSQVPYRITVDKKAVNGGDTVQITLSTQSSSGRPFKGFLVVGRKENYKKEKTPQGTFISEVESSSGGEKLAQITGCSEIPSSSMTHSNAKEKTQVVLNWRAPNVDGNYVIVATFVADHDTYWVEQPSEMIQVKRSETLQEVATSATPRATPSPAVQSELDTLYDGCGNKSALLPKGCFGLGPSKCVEGGRDCELLVTYRMDGENGVRFELMGREDVVSSNSYVAVGLSKDASMGEDSVFGCRKDGNGFVVNEYFNTGKVNGGVDRPTSIIANPTGRYLDGYIICTFNVKPPKNLVEIPGGDNYKFDLAQGRFNLLLARGPNSAKDYLGKHPKLGDRDVAPRAVRLDEVVIATGKSPILVELHGAFMIMAWLLCASSGMFTARYYKQTHTNTKPCGVAFWFAFHRFCMALTILLSLTASVLIFVENNFEYTQNPQNAVAEKYHPILGIILTCLAILQVLVAFCRPNPTARKRFLFNWFHWLTGNCAHIVGIACIFLANDLNKTNLGGQSRYWGVLTGFIVFHVLLHILMSVHTLKADKQMEIQNKKRAVLPGPMKLSGLDAEAPGTGFRTAILTVYILGAAVTASLLVYFVIDSLEG